MNRCLPHLVATVLTFAVMTLAAQPLCALVTDDGFGVAHVRTNSLSEALHGLGQLHARDRGSQLENLRALAQGRGEQVFGPAGLELDRGVLVGDYLGQVDRVLQEMEPGDRELLEAYVGGVNEGLPKGHLPWTAANSVEIIFYFAQYLSAAGSWTSDQLSHFGMSNSWYGKGSTLAGESSWLMAADPHLPVEGIPGRFYAAHLDIVTSGGKRSEIVGIGVPGVPVFTFASGNRLAWSITSMQFESYKWTSSRLVPRAHDWLFNDGKGHLRTLAKADVVIDTRTRIVRIVGQSPRLLQFHETDPVRGESYLLSSVTWAARQASGLGLGHLFRLPTEGRAQSVSDAVAEFHGLSAFWLSADAEGGLKLREGVSSDWSAGTGPGLEQDFTGKDFMANNNNWPDLPRPVSAFPFPERHDRILALRQETPRPTVADFARWQRDSVDTTLVSYATLLTRAATLALRYPPADGEYPWDMSSGQKWWQLASTWKPETQKTDRASQEADFALVQLCARFASTLTETPYAPLPGQGWLEGWSHFTPGSFYHWGYFSQDAILRDAFIRSLAGWTPEKLEVTWAAPSFWPLSLFLQRTSPSLAIYPWALSLRGAGQHTAVLRLLGEISDHGVVRLVVPPGQSDSPFSPHYDDFLAPWSKGEYHQIQLGDDLSGN